MAVVTIQVENHITAMAAHAIMVKDLSTVLTSWKEIIEMHFAVI